MGIFLFVALPLFFLIIEFVNKKILKNESWILLIPMYFVFLRSNNTRDMMLWQTEYINLIIAFTLVFGISYKAIFSDSSKKILFIIVNGIFLFMLTASGIRYLAEYILPMIVAIAIIFVIEEKGIKLQNIISYIKIILPVIVIPFIIGYLFNKYICSTHLTWIGTNDNEIEIVRTAGKLFKNIRLTSINLIRIFGYNKKANIANNVTSIIIAIAVFIVGPVLECLRFKKVSKERKTLILFGIMHNLVLLAIIILTTKTHERYLLSSVFVAILFTADYVYDICFSSEKKVRYFLIPFFMIATVLLSINLAKVSTLNGGWKDALASQKKVGDILVEKGVTKAYASYWNAYTYEYYSNNRVTFGSIYPSERVLEKHYTLVDMKAFQKKEGRSCILFTKDENEQFNRAVHIILGPEAETFTIKDTYVFDFYNDYYYKTDLVVYIYDEDVCDKLTDGIADGLCQVNEMQFNWYGTMDEDTIYLDNNGFVHGPYSKIEAGHYNVKIEGEGLTGCNCAIVSELTPEYISSTVTDINDEYIEIDLTILKRVEDIQFCLANPKDETVEFKDVRITKQ